MLKKEYNQFRKETSINYLCFILLEMIVEDYEFLENVLLTHKEVYKPFLDELEKNDLIRITEDGLIPSELGVKYIRTNSDANIVINTFNELKEKYHISKIASKCNAEKPSINARIKEYGLIFVLATLEAKFVLWSNDPMMRPHLSSMATLMKAQGFESWVAKADVFKNKTIMSNKNTNLI